MSYLGMIDVPDIIAYLENVHPDTVYFEAGYAESCPVAKYGRDKYGLKEPAFNGTYLVESKMKFMKATNALTKAIYEMEYKLGIEVWGTVTTAKEVLAVLKG